MKTFTQRTTKSDEWATPAKLFAEIAAEFGPFNTDPCATAENTKAPRWYDRDADGLIQPWYGRVFINPPFSQIEAWAKRAFEESQRGLTVVMLIPARTGAGWWHRWECKGARMILDAEETRGLLAYMHEQENLPPEEMAKKRRYLEQCKAFALYSGNSATFPAGSRPASNERPEPMAPRPRP